MIEEISQYAEFESYKNHEAVAFTLISDNYSPNSDYKRLTQWCHRNNILFDSVLHSGFIDISVDIKDKEQFTDAMNHIVWLCKFGLYETYDIIF